MAQTTLINTITKTGDYPEKVSVSADNNCGTLQLLLGGTWTNQMIHELPTINISIYTTDNTKYLSFDVDMSTVNEELIKLEPTNPYSIAIYNIPSNFSFYITPIFDKYALSSHNAVIKDGNIEIFNTTDKGIVDSNENDYDSELWTTPTDTFDISIIFDDSNISSSGGGGGGGSQTVIAANVIFDNSTTGLTSNNVQDVIVEIDTKINELPEPMIFKGSLGTGGTISELPTASSENKGFTYKVITDGTYQGIVAKVGDTFISDGTNWVLIPSGDEPSGTVTNVAITSTDGSATITGSPITSSGTINISVNVDNELSDTSTKPVQNKIVTVAINEKLDIDDAVGKNVTGTEYTIDGQTVTALDGAEIFNDYQNNKATGLDSHAEGYSTLATAVTAHAEGSTTKATGSSSHAEGSLTQATGNSAHAEGASTKATGYASHAEGNSTQASGHFSHTEGAGTEATSMGSHAEGSGSRAIGTSSHAEGNGTQANGDCSHTEGLYTIASTNQHVQGKYNIAQGDLNTEMAFIIGNGTSDQNRSNAFSIDWNGNIYVNGDTTGVNVSTLSSILNPISESEYDAITTKDKPLYFIYET